MSFTPDQLSAYLDGELPEAEAAALETALETDTALQAELDALMAADAAAGAAFAEMLADQVPAALAAAIRNAPESQPAANLPGAPRGLPAWAAAAACAAFLAIGATGGYLAGTGKGAGTEVAALPAWLVDIADYHAVYAGQTRHLVEVPASEADHIATWLTASVGAEVRIPDLADQGLTFQGGRLLVAAGKPVAQLLYTDAAGEVVALCQIRSDKPADGFRTADVKGFGLVSWGGGDANFVVVGPEGYQGLETIAETAAQRV